MAKRRSRRSATRGRRSRAKPKSRLTPAQRGWILVLFAVAGLTVLGLLPRSRGNPAGLWADILRRAFGWGAYLVPLALALAGLGIVARGMGFRLVVPRFRLVGVLSVVVSFLSLSHHFLRAPERAMPIVQGGGLVGYWVSRALSGALGRAGATVVLVCTAAIGLSLAFAVTLAEVMAACGALVHRAAGWRETCATAWRRLRASVASAASRRSPGQVPARGLGRSPAVQPAEPGLGGAGQGSPRSVSPQFAPLGATRRPARWALPSMEDVLLERDETEARREDIREVAGLIERTFASLGAPVRVVEANPGPVVTQFGLEPGYLERRDRRGRVRRVKVRVSRICGLADDLALALAASPVRVEAPVPGKSIVGLEVPNGQPALVGLRGVMQSEQFRAVPSRLALALGRDVSGAAAVDDLARLPHLLIAGATGSGKSVCINALIACLLCRNTPDDLKLIMIDPKRVELSAYDGIPHLVAPVVVETARVVAVLNWLMQEMDHRFRVFASVGTRNLHDYNGLAVARREGGMPYIVGFIDELADLMLVAPDEVERLICRIAQMARATGIHLVMATQRPSTDVVTGLIKANFPARLSFAVSSLVDSRVVLDAPGAERLLGQGDALYMAPDRPQMTRLRGCYVSDEELVRLTSFWKEQGAAKASEVPSRGVHQPFVEKPLVQRALWPKIGASEEEKRDPFLDRATALVVAEQRASVSLLQRKLGIGYTRAARLVDALEEGGIVGPPTGSSRAREVLRQPEKSGAVDVSQSAARR